MQVAGTDPWFLFIAQTIRIVETVDLVPEYMQSIKMFMSAVGWLWFEHQSEVLGLLLKTPLCP